MKVDTSRLISLGCLEIEIAFIKSDDRLTDTCELDGRLVVRVNRQGEQPAKNPMYWVFHERAPQCLWNVHDRLSSARSWRSSNSCRVVLALPVRPAGETSSKTGPDAFLLSPSTSNTFSSPVFSENSWRRQTQGQLSLLGFKTLVESFKSQRIGSFLEPLNNWRERIPTLSKIVPGGTGLAWFRWIEASTGVAENLVARETPPINDGAGKGGTTKKSTHAKSSFEDSRSRGFCSHIFL